MFIEKCLKRINIVFAIYANSLNTWMLNRYALVKIANTEFVKNVDI